MKKLSIILCMGLFVFMRCEKETTILTADLPAEIKAYIQTHFATCQISRVVKDRAQTSYHYDVDLNCAVNLEFDHLNKVKDIEANHPLPVSVLPPALINYVAANYPANKIHAWELDMQNQRIDLDNGLVLEFNMQGLFIRIV